MLGYLEWIAFGLSLVGVIFNIKKQRVCFGLWFIACLIWIHVMAEQGAWGMVATQIIFTGTNIWGWIVWGRETKVEFQQELRTPLTKITLKAIEYGFTTQRVPLDLYKPADGVLILKKTKGWRSIKWNVTKDKR